MFRSSLTPASWDSPYLHRLHPILVGDDEAKFVFSLGQNERQNGEMARLSLSVQFLTPSHALQRLDKSESGPAWHLPSWHLHVELPRCPGVDRWPPHPHPEHSGAQSLAVSSLTAPEWSLQGAAGK